MEETVGRSLQPLLLPFNKVLSDTEETCLQTLASVLSVLRAALPSSCPLRRLTRSAPLSMSSSPKYYLPGSPRKLSPKTTLPPTPMEPLTRAFHSHAISASRPEDGDEPSNRHGRERDRDRDHQHHRHLGIENSSAFATASDLSRPAPPDEKCSAGAFIARGAASESSAGEDDAAAPNSAAASAATCDSARRLPGLSAEREMKQVAAEAEAAAAAAAVAAAAAAAATAGIVSPKVAGSASEGGGSSSSSSSSSRSGSRRRRGDVSRGGPGSSGRQPFTELSQADADLALARALQEQECALMLLTQQQGLQRHHQQQHLQHLLVGGLSPDEVAPAASAAAGPMEAAGVTPASDFGAAALNSEYATAAAAVPVCGSSGGQSHGSRRRDRTLHRRSSRGVAAVAEAALVPALSSSAAAAGSGCDYSTPAGHAGGVAEEAAGPSRLRAEEEVIDLSSEDEDGDEDLEEIGARPAVGEADDGWRRERRRGERRQASERDEGSLMRGCDLGHCVGDAEEVVVLGGGSSRVNHLRQRNFLDEIEGARIEGSGKVDEDGMVEASDEGEDYLVEEAEDEDEADMDEAEDHEEEGQGGEGGEGGEGRQETDEELAWRLQMEEEREMAARMMAMAGIPPRAVVAMGAMDVGLDIGMHGVLDEASWRQMMQAVQGDRPASRSHGRRRGGAREGSGTGEEAPENPSAERGNDDDEVEEEDYELEVEGEEDEQYEDEDDDFDDDGIDVDNMTYEELTALGEAIGTESKGLSAAAIAALPRFVHLGEDRQQKPQLHGSRLSTGGKEAEEDEEEELCAICRLEYEEGDTLIRLTPCDHAYHEECIVQWLGMNKACPICKVEVQAQHSPAESRCQRKQPSPPAMPSMRRM